MAATHNHKQGPDAMSLNPQQRKANLRLALILASVAAVFALGFMSKIAWLAT